MHHLTRASRLIACSLVTLSATSAFAAGPDVIKNARHDTSLSLAQLATGPGATLKQTDREMAEPRATRAPFASGRADHLADRWMVSQLQYDETFTKSAECIAISTSSDATGSYSRYEFDFGANFPDYPKFGVWPDGYYNSINVFPGKTFAGAQACAFDRAAMLAGAAASAICFQQASSVSSLLPADLDGSRLPPAGAPNYFVGLADATHLNLFRFHADFANPAASTFGAPMLIEVAPYDEICARATTASCIPEPEPGEKVDGLSDRVMFRLAYRNFGDHEALVVNHTVRGGALGGVRWYEIRNPSGTPTIFQQGTIVDPDTDFWLGSVSMDRAGNIAVGFSAMSKRDFSSVYVAGRKASDPKDDCTFWYTQEYYISTGSLNWATHVGAFKFDNCRPGGK